MILRCSLLFHFLPAPFSHLFPGPLLELDYPDSFLGPISVPEQLQSPGAAAAKLLSRVQLCATSQMAAHQAPTSKGFSRQEHWSGVPLPSPATPQCRPPFTIHLCSHLSLQFTSTQECAFQLHTKLLATLTRIFFKDSSTRHFLVVQWLEFYASTAGA